MIRVPLYERNVSLRPAFQQGLNTQADAASFGSGKGLQSMADGLDHFAVALDKRQQLDDMTRAKEAEVSYSQFLQERMYGEGGYMQLKNADAVNGRTSFINDANAMREKLGSGLSRRAKSYYLQGSSDSILDAQKQSILHSAREQKNRIISSYQSQIDFHRNDALLHDNEPEEVNRNIAKGQRQIAELGLLQGEKPDAIKAQQTGFAHDTYMAVAFKKAENDPIAAENYINSLGETLPAESREQFYQHVGSKIFNAKVNRHQNDILASLPAARYQLQKPENRLEESHATTLPTYKPVDVSVVARETKGLEALSDDAPPLAFIRNSVGNKIAPNLAPWASTVAHAVLGDHEIDANGNNKTAAAFMQFGMATDAPEIGDIVVSGENGTPAHVGFYQGVDESGNILVYGNRQAQGQPISLVAPEQLLATRKAGRVDIQTAALGHYDPKALIAINDHLANIDDEEMREATHDRLFDTFKQQKTAIETSRRDGMAELVNTLRSDLTYNLDTLPDEQKQLIGADMLSAIKARQDAMLQGTFRNDAATLAMLAQQRRHDPQAYINADPNLVYASLTDASFDAYTQDQKRMAEQLATPESFEQQLAQAEMEQTQAEPKSVEDIINNAEQDDIAKLIEETQDVLPIDMTDSQRTLMQSLLPQDPNDPSFYLQPSTDGNSLKNPRLTGTALPEWWKNIKVSYHNIPAEKIPLPLERPEIKAQEEFLNTIMPEIYKIAESTGLDPRLIAAQAILETGWGKHLSGNNYFGIKSHGKKGGHPITTHEVLPNGKRIKIVDNFRQYKNFKDSLNDYVAFIKNNPRYDKLLKAKTLTEQLNELKKSGYATEKKYINLLSDTIKYNIPYDETKWHLSK